MREFKFRAFDNKNKKWLLGYEYPNLGGFSLFGEAILFGEWGNVFDKFLFEREGLTWKDLVVEQYTGLKDKNGKDIYEGDYYINKEDPGRNIYIVFFNAGAFCGGKSLLDSIPLGFNEEDHDIFPDHTEWIQVIGNIHEPIPQLTK